MATSQTTTPDPHCRPRGDRGLCPDVTAPQSSPASEGGSSADRSVMLAAVGRPRPDDDPQTAALRRVLRDRRYMARVAVAVDQWPALTDEQRDTVAAILRPRRRDR